MAEALASLEQLQDRMDLPITNPTRANQMLEDASATVRAYTTQTFTREVTTERLRVRAGWVRLPQRPANDVTAVASPTGAVLGYSWPGMDRLYVPPGAVYSGAFALGGYYAGEGWVDVTYDHGYDVIPDDIEAVVCNVAARALGGDPSRAGVTTQSITNFSESFGPVGASGPVGLFDDEKAILDRYRRDVGVAWIGPGPTTGGVATP